MSSAEHSNIHRRLDEAFDGAAMNAELRDLKEEIRSNLLARVAELQTGGATAAAAAATAFEELGDLGEVIREVASDPGAMADPAAVAAAAAAPADPDLGLPPHPGHPAHPEPDAAGYPPLHKVTPRPGFATGILLLSVVALASLVLFAMTTGESDGAGLAVLAALCAAVAAGIITGWSLKQETSQNHPLPTRRALGYGACAAAAVFGLAMCALVASAGAGMLAAGIFVVLGSAVGFIWLGLSQTNRKKAWARDLARNYREQDGFAQDPVAAARFGIYTAAIWIVSFAAFVGLGFTVGFAISWVALLAGLAVFMLVLARMLFPANKKLPPAKAQK